jgi:hypothetical protein
MWKELAESDQDNYVKYWGAGREIAPFGGLERHFAIKKIFLE